MSLVSVKRLVDLAELASGKAPIELNLKLDHFRRKRLLVTALTGTVILVARRPTREPIMMRESEQMRETHSAT